MSAIQLWTQLLCQPCVVARFRFLVVCFSLIGFGRLVWWCYPLVVPFALEVFCERLSSPLRADLCQPSSSFYQGGTFANNESVLKTISKCFIIIQFLFHKYVLISWVHQ